MLNLSQNSHAGPAIQQPNTSTTLAGPSVSTPRSRPTSLQQKPSGFDMANLINTPDSRPLALRPLSHINAVVAEILSLDNLPEVPDDLKTHIAAYVQRARELAGKDPVMCYWCLYFAAKRGVLARTSRPWLFKLMDSLEMVKRELRDDDAVASEDAGHAYIESFALKVFNLADVEDQGGNATRSTAKKFLAAANFFEMLTVFDAIHGQPENEEKIKYAKWKAASIARDVRDNGSDETKTSSGSKALPSVLPDRRKSDPPAISTKPPVSSIPPRVPSSGLLSSDRYLAPPQQKGAPPSVPSSFGTLPASTATSANPSPSSVPQAHLPVTPNTAVNPKLPSPKLTPQANGALPDPPTQKLSTSPSENRAADDKFPSGTSTKTPTAAPSGGRPRRQTNESLPKSGFFASIAGKMFGSRDGQVTPGAWSNQATPGTEDDNLRLPHAAVPSGKGETKEKTPPPLSGTSPPQGAGVTRALVGGTAAAIVSSRRDDRGEIAIRTSVNPNSNSSQNDKRPELRKSGSNPSPVSPNVQAPAAPAAKKKRDDVSPSRNLPTTAVVRPSPPLQPEVTVISLIPEQTISNPPNGLQRTRRASDDKQQVRPSEASGIPSKALEAEQGGRRAERRDAPLPTKPAAPVQPLLFARVAALKRVHFSGSVVGGLSSDAGTSPPSPTEIKANPLTTTAIESSKQSSEKQDLPDSTLMRSVHDSVPRKPRPLSVGDAIPARLTALQSTSPVTQLGGGASSSANPSAVHSHQVEPSSKGSFPPANSGPPGVNRPPKLSPSELLQAVPVSIPGGRQRAHSFGQSSLVGSAGSYVTMTANRTSPVPAPLPSTSPKARPMAIPPISRTLPPLQQQQPTPSPSPPSAQLLPSPVSYTAVPAPLVKPVIEATAVPPAPAMSTSPPFAQSKPTVAHVATPYTRPEDLPAALTAEVMLNARKHTKYAMSALEFDDVETARTQLRRALEALEVE